MDSDTKQTILVVGHRAPHELIMKALKSRPEIRIIQVDDGEEDPRFEDIDKKLLDQVDLVNLSDEAEVNPLGDLMAYTLDEELKRPGRAPEGYQKLHAVPGPMEMKYYPLHARPGRARVRNHRKFEGLSRPLTQAGPKQPGRNTPCHCGSGKKFKKCCIGKGNG